MATNRCYAVTKIVDTEEVYATISEHSHNTEFSTTETVTNQCYSTSLRRQIPCVNQQQDMQFTQTSGNIPMETNQCYGTNLASVEEEHDSLTADDYDYIIP